MSVMVLGSSELLGDLRCFWIFETGLRCKQRRRLAGPGRFVVRTPNP
jgi:hypothetical protein